MVDCNKQDFIYFFLGYLHKKCLHIHISCLINIRNKDTIFMY